jgi:hypothetical protein
MTAINAFFFVAGALASGAALFLAYPWISGRPRSEFASALPRRLLAGGGIALLAVLGVYLKIGSPQMLAQDSIPAAAAAVAASPDAAPALMPGLMPGAAAPAAGGPGAAGPAMAGSGRPAAGSMDNAVSGLEHRLAATGGSDSDWELLAKSYEFLGRPADAALARQKRLPAGGGGASPAAAAGAPATASRAAPAGAAGLVLRGEVVLSDALRSKVPAGLTLFVVAKSVRSPGPPVAILRTTTGRWPLQFQLDDSNSMVPGRNLSTAGEVTIEARTSRSGQAMPEAGDFQGVTAPLNPAAGKPVHLVIERVIG